MNEYYYIILNKEKINYLFNTESIPEELAVHVDYEKYFYCKDVVVLQYLNSDSTVVNVKFRDENLKRIRNRIYSSTFEGYILKSNLRLELTQHLE